MNIFQERAAIARELDAADLRVGDSQVQVYAHLPEAACMPAILIEPADEWIMESETFGAWVISWELTVAVDVATNEKATADLDQLLADVIDALGGVAEVGAPFAYAANTAVYLAARLTWTTTTNLTKE